MRHHVLFLSLALLSGFVAVGCDPPKPVAGTSSPPAPPSPPPPPASDSNSSRPSGAEGFAGIAGTGILEEVQGTRPPTTSTEPASAPETELVEAKKGVGLKGRSLDAYEGPVVTPAKTFFAVKERIAFEVQVPHALQLYEATNGAAPKTHDQFMKEIIEANQIKLPVLPQGHEYQYDPETKQLMVKRPKRE